MNPENDLIAIQTHKEISRLYKTFLETIEDVRSNNNIMLKKIADKNGQRYADDVNYFTDQYYEHLRKRVLDNGNDCNRQLLAFLEYFDFIINKEKVERAVVQKRIVKKFVSSAHTVIE